jgi:hypothetical protein
MTDSNRLPILAEEIKRAHSGVFDAAKTAAEGAIDAGRGRGRVMSKNRTPNRNWRPLPIWPADALEPDDPGLPTPPSKLLPTPFRPLPSMVFYPLIPFP